MRGRMTLDQRARNRSVLHASIQGISLKLCHLREDNVSQGLCRTLWAGQGFDSVHNDAQWIESFNGNFVMQESKHFTMADVYDTIKKGNEEGRKMNRNSDKVVILLSYDIRKLLIKARHRISN